MKQTKNKLEFISWINRDGSGTTPMEETETKPSGSVKLKLWSLSLTEKTFIASDGFNCFVVKLKDRG